MPSPQATPAARSPSAWPALAAALSTALFAGWLRAADTPDTSPRAARNAAPAALMAQARQAIAAKQWAQASGLLDKAVAQAPEDADAHNLLGYSLRWQGKLPEALASYDRALKINPKHLGALEYQGIAYLMAGQPDKARAHLAALERLCPSGCEERDTLAQRLAAQPVAAKP